MKLAHVRYILSFAKSGIFAAAIGYTFFKSLAPRKGCAFIPIPGTECPDDPNLSSCDPSEKYLTYVKLVITTGTAIDGDLCEADEPLVGGTTEIDNCKLDFDVYRYSCEGTLLSLLFPLR